MMALVVVTGGSGFIGRHVVGALALAGHSVREAGRRPSGIGAPFVEVGDIGPDTDWQAALEGAEAVVHLAGLAHRSAEDDDFMRVNALGTQRLAEACASAGVRTLVNVSSIAARSVGTADERASAYGRSKLLAEEHVAIFGERPGRAGISLRPPLVYGHDAPANWAALQKLAATGLPLPFGAVQNRRSLCAVENLAGAVTAATAAGLAGQGSGTYEVADTDIVSLAGIVRQLRRGMGLPARLVAVPTVLLRLGGRLTGRTEMVSALIDDLVLDPRPFMQAFGWSPARPTAEAIVESGRRYASR